MGSRSARIPGTSSHSHRNPVSGVDLLLMLLCCQWGWDKVPSQPTTMTRPFFHPPGDSRSSLGRPGRALTRTTGTSCGKRGGDPLGREGWALTRSREVFYEEGEVAGLVPCLEIGFLIRAFLPMPFIWPYNCLAHAGRLWIPSTGGCFRPVRPTRFGRASSCRPGPTGRQSSGCFSISS